MTTINPYLTFNGNCQEAFNFYKKVFQKEFSYIGTFSDMPDNPEYPVLESEKDKIMHVSLPISEETNLMGSDTSEAFGKVANPGSNFSISVNTRDPKEVERIFNELAEGGQITMPLNKTFWGAYFGMLIDQFDIQWMVNCETEDHKNYVDNK